MYGLRNSELSTCLFQFSHKTCQTMLFTLILLPKSTLNANLTTTNRFFTNDDRQCGRNFESDHQYESNLESDVRFEIESNHEASQVPKTENKRSCQKHIITYFFCSGRIGLPPAGTIPCKYVTQYSTTSSCVICI